MSWHVSAEVLTRYAGGEAGPAEAHSLEAHVLACGRCRRDIAVRFPAAPLEQVWSGVLDRVESSRPGWVERLLLHVGTPDHVARLLAATPSLQLSWFAATSVALRVPSAVVPIEFNFVLNPKHPDFAKLVIGPRQPLPIDPRLLGKK